MTFIVRDNFTNEFIQDAEIEFLGKTVMSSENGKYVFYDVNYSDNEGYIIKKSGYNDVIGAIAVKGNNTTFSIQMSQTAATTSVETPSETELNIYPNPSSGIFNVEFLNADNTQEYSIKVYDVLGSLIYVKSIIGNEIVNEQIDISDKAKGMYILSLESENSKSIYNRIIVR